MTPAEPELDRDVVDLRARVEAREGAAERVGQGLRAVWQPCAELAGGPQRCGHPDRTEALQHVVDGERIAGIVSQGPSH